MLNLLLQQNMRSKSLVKLPSTTQNNKYKKNNHDYDIVNHRKQIQGTLKELHKLQSQIYDLNVAENPHSSSPVKKQIKQLSYLYENMVKPKQKNALNIKSQDIQIALRILNKEWDQEVELDKEMLEETNLLMNSTLKTKKTAPTSLRDHTYKIPKDTLKYKYQQITKEQLNVDFITHATPQSALKNDQLISVKQLYTFLNYTDCDAFDPVDQAYNMFINPDSGKFDMHIYNQFSKILGLPQIKNWNTFLSAIHLIEGREQPVDPTNITLKQFREVFNFKL